MRVWHSREAGGLDRIQHGSGNADIGNGDVSAQRPARQQHMRRLLAEEGDRHIGLHASAARAAGQAVET